MYEENWKQLELSGVELTDDELGRGSYGYVIGLKVKGVRCVDSKVYMYIYTVHVFKFLFLVLLVTN